MVKRVRLTKPVKRMFDLKEIDQFVKKHKPIPKPKGRYRRQLYSFDPTKMKSLVKEVVSYRDTVKIWFRYEPTEAEVIIFKNHSDPKKLDIRDKPLRWTVKDKNTGKVKRDPRTGEIKWIISSDWLHSVKLFQPERIIFKYLEAQYPNHNLYLLNGLEVSLDLITETKYDAEQLKSFFTAHWIKKFAKKPDVREVTKTKGKSGTIYYQEERGEKDFKIYADRPSKIKIGKPCCHIEVKFNSIEAVRAAKFNLDLFGGQKHFNYRMFWEKYLILKRIDGIKLEKTLLRKYPKYPVCGGNKNLKDFISALIYRAGRISTVIGKRKNKKVYKLDGPISTQAMKKTLKLGWNYLEKISNDGFIPTANDYYRKIKKIRY